MKLWLRKTEAEKGNLKTTSHQISSSRRLSGKYEADIERRPRKISFLARKYRHSNLASNICVKRMCARVIISARDYKTARDVFSNHWAPIALF